MKKLTLYGFLFSVTILFCAVLYSCSGDGTITATVDPENDAAISTSEDIVISFSGSMDPDSLELSGSMSADSDDAVWSKTDKDNDTLTISPSDQWDASQVGTLVVTVNNKNGDETELELSYGVVLNITTFQGASLVIGQPDFTSWDADQGGSEADNNLDYPYGMPGYYKGDMYVPDYNNSRVLKFNSVPTHNNASANVVIGEPDFTTTVGGNAANETSGPTNVQGYNDKLYVLDYSNSRILIFNDVPTTNGESANHVIGQTGFGVSTSDCTRSTLNIPDGMIIVDGKLIVSDTSNNRILIWNELPTTNGSSADLVLGQDSFTQCAENDKNQDGAADGSPNKKTLSEPTGIWSDGTKIIVSDSGNNRVLIWNTFPTSNFESADVVIGQSDFTHNADNDDNQDGVAGNPTSRTFSYPWGLSSNGTQLFVADDSNARVLIWNTIPTSNFARANVVLGQGDFTHNATNDADQDGISDAGTSKKVLGQPSGVAIIENKLVINDATNSRYLMYQEVAE